MRNSRPPSMVGKIRKPSDAVTLALTLALHIFVVASLGLFLGLSGCARVLQKDREYLSDPIMQLTPDPLGQGLESHNLPRREGSAGGGSGSGGGCGC